MLSTLITIASATTLMTHDVPPVIPRVIPWNENILIESTVRPQKNETNIAPVIEASSALVVDLDSGVILYEKNIFEPRPIASLTKLMTTTIVLEENNINDITTISSNAAATEGKKIWLLTNETISIENLLLAALIDSANDAAVALAEANAGNVEAFVEKMNNRSQELGMISTRFSNPTGLDESPSTENTLSDNISTAYDLALLAKHAYSKSFIRRTAQKQQLTIASNSGNTEYDLVNTNLLLGSYLKVLGLKTGTTDNAGECLITIIETPEDHTIMTILLNSPNRFTEAKVLADWTMRTYSW